MLTYVAGYLFTLYTPRLRGLLKEIKTFVVAQPYHGPLIQDLSDYCRQVLPCPVAQHKHPPLLQGKRKSTPGQEAQQVTS